MCERLVGLIFTSFLPPFFICSVTHSLFPLLRLQEEDALLSEMDVTGQAFEDMQEQNIRLMQQLREKDDANFKLMSERIKSNQIHKLLKEEKEELADQLLTLKTQVENLNLEKNIYIKLVFLCVTNVCHFCLYLCLA